MSKMQKISAVFILTVLASCGGSREEIHNKTDGYVTLDKGIIKPYLPCGSSLKASISNPKSQIYVGIETKFIVNISGGTGNYLYGNEGEMPSKQITNGAEINQKFDKVSEKQVLKLVIKDRVCGTGSILAMSQEFSVIEKKPEAIPTSQPVPSIKVPKVELSIMGMRSEINYGESVNFLITTSEADKCTLYNSSTNVTYKVPVNAVFNTGALYETSDFILQCSNANASEVNMKRIVVKSMVPTVPAESPSVQNPMAPKEVTCSASQVRDYYILVDEKGVPFSQNPVMAYFNLVSGNPMVPIRVTKVTYPGPNGTMQSSGNDGSGLHGIPAYGVGNFPITFDIASALDSNVKGSCKAMLKVEARQASCSVTSSLDSVTLGSSLSLDIKFSGVPHQTLNWGGVGLFDNTYYRAAIKVTPTTVGNYTVRALATYLDSNENVVEKECASKMITVLPITVPAESKLPVVPEVIPMELPEDAPTTSSFENKLRIVNILPGPSLGDRIFNSENLILDFGEAYAGEKIEKTVLLKNTGISPLFAYSHNWSGLGIGLDDNTCEIKGGIFSLAGITNFWNCNHRTQSYLDQGKINPGQIVAARFVFSPESLVNPTQVSFQIQAWDSITTSRVGNLNTQMNVYLRGQGVRQESLVPIYRHFDMVNIDYRYSDNRWPGNNDWEFVAQNFSLFKKASPSRVAVFECKKEDHHFTSPGSCGSFQVSRILGYASFVKTAEASTPVVRCYGLSPKNPNNNRHILTADPSECTRNNMIQEYTIYSPK